jgi:hypothetical protein
VARLPQPGPASVKPTRPSFPHIRQYHAIADNDLMTSGAGRFGNALSEFGQYALSASTLLGELSKKVIRTDVAPEPLLDHDRSIVGDPNIYGLYSGAGKYVALNPKNDTKSYPGSTKYPTPEWKNQTRDESVGAFVHETMHAGFDELRSSFRADRNPNKRSGLNSVIEGVLQFSAEQEHAVLEGVMLLKGGIKGKEDSEVSRAFLGFLTDASEGSAQVLVNRLRSEFGYKHMVNSYLKEGYEDFVRDKKFWNGEKSDGQDPAVEAMSDTFDKATDGEIKTYLYELRDAIKTLPVMAKEAQSRRISEKIKQADAEGDR